MLTDLAGPKGVLKLDEGRSKMRLDLRAPRDRRRPDAALRRHDRQVRGSTRGAGTIVRDQVAPGRPDDELIAIAERRLLARSPIAEPALDEIGAIAARVRDDRSICKVDDLLTIVKVGKRSLERRFNSYVGVSPKWVIKRYRLVEAAEEIARDTEIDWVRLAVDLGYYDQAHLIRDFKGLIGLTPAEYAHAIRR